MRRDPNLLHMPWAAKTRSAMRAARMEECEKWLQQQPNRGLFTSDDPDVSDLWALSWDGAERPMLPHMFSRQQLQKRIMLRLPAEAALLSEAEEELCERLIKEHGFIPLQGLEDTDAAVSLVRRLWASVITVDEIQALALQPPVMLSLGMVRLGDEYDILRDGLMEVCRDVDGLLYLYGVIPAEEARLPLANALKDSFADDEQLLDRFIRLDFDYAYGPDGELLLVHPGLADPASVPVYRNPWKGPHDETILRHASDGALWIEVDAFREMMGSLQGALRPECDPAATVEDLAFLCKQNVPMAQLEQALSSFLIVTPTQLMLDCLRRLNRQVPRWQGLKSEVLH